MDDKKSWISKVKSELQKSPLASNVLFGFILTGLEKIVEMEFACPCKPKWNAVFASAFFCAPVVLVVLLMTYIQYADDDESTKGKKADDESTKGKKEESKSDKWKCEKLFSIFVPALLWLILLLMDGQYVACAMTSWPGRFVSVDKGEPQKWCEPANHTNQASSKDLMMKTQLWFTLSQGIGIALIFLLSFAIGVYWMCCKKKSQKGCEQKEGQEMVCRVPTSTGN